MKRKGAKFMRWGMDQNYEIKAQYQIPSGQMVDVHTLQMYNYCIPSFPDYHKWMEKTGRKERCPYCWKSIRGHKDLIHHVDRAHSSPQNWNGPYV